jgi:cob(I)alamin adenosyltransferase
MSSIATKTGDAGSTGLVGGLRVSKADLRVEAYGTVDELDAFLGFARSICTHPDIKGWTESIQRDLFRVGSALSTPVQARKQGSSIAQADVDRLTGLVHQIEATPNILADWSLPGANTESAAYEIARTVCRRAERLAVRFAQETADPDLPASAVPVVPPQAIAYLNRLSDLIWLFGRLIEVRAGVDSKLRDETKPGPNFSRAW